MLCARRRRRTCEIFGRKWSRGRVGGEVLALANIDNGGWQGVLLCSGGLPPRLDFTCEISSVNSLMKQWLSTYSPPCECGVCACVVHGRSPHCPHRHDPQPFWLKVARVRGPGQTAGPARDAACCGPGRTAGATRDTARCGPGRTAGPARDNALCPSSHRRSGQGHSTLCPWPDRRCGQGHRPVRP